MPSATSMAARRLTRACCSNAKAAASKVPAERSPKVWVTLSGSAMPATGISFSAATGGVRTSANSNTGTAILRAALIKSSSLWSAPPTMNADGAPRVSGALKVEFEFMSHWQNVKHRFAGTLCLSGTGRRESKPGTSEATRPDAVNRLKPLDRLARRKKSEIRNPKFEIRNLAPTDGSGWWKQPGL